MLRPATIDRAGDTNSCPQSGHGSCPAPWVATTIISVKTLKLPRRAIGVVVAAALIGAACSKADTAATGSDDSSAATNSAAGAGGDTASEPAAESRVNLPVVAEEVRVGDLVLTVNTTGQVRSDAEAKLKAEVTGTVQTVHVRPGDRVEPA